LVGGSPRRQVTEQRGGASGDCRGYTTKPGVKKNTGEKQGQKASPRIPGPTTSEMQREAIIKKRKEEDTASVFLMQRAPGFTQEDYSLRPRPRKHGRLRKKSSAACTRQEIPCKRTEKRHRQKSTVLERSGWGTRGIEKGFTTLSKGIKTKSPAGIQGFNPSQGK